ncbi:hypothetical protein EW093_00880 [Thiospirochaeta perfilievii]|uniref:Uncharacterized protein n=1 Tax=Thiospirochaeta perfilievii TaxID=252967 RepID=A0A5C1Q7G2_9SPIO|nr:FHIPEP family type III secretion protein [Thiospirochaeta perfilievii]QEN03317.1 hypothetical protein EW093_00880 [Thiospirochaeta perfilievii]
MNNTEDELNITNGIWISYNNESDQLTFVNSLKGKNTNWDQFLEYKCVFQEGLLNKKTFERKSYCICAETSVTEQLLEGEYLIYYSNDLNMEASIPRILIKLTNGTITKIRGIGHGQNIEPGIIDVLWKKLTLLGDIGKDYLQSCIEEKLLDSIEDKHNVTSFTPIDPLSLDLGYGLIPLIDKEYGSELLDRINKIRHETVMSLGLPVPEIRIMENIKINPSEYIIKLNGFVVGRGEINLGQYLAINPGGKRKKLIGTKTKDPAFGLPAIWITEDIRVFAEVEGYTVADTPSIIATHLDEIIHNYAHELLGLQDVVNIMDTLKVNYPAILEETDKEYTISDILQVLKGLLKEQISIRNIISILEILIENSSNSKGVNFLIKKIKAYLSQ